MASKHFTTWIWILSALRNAGLFCELTWGGVERSLWWAGWGRGWQAWPIVWSSWALSTYFVLLACLRASACQEPGIKFSPRRNLQNLFRILCMTVCSVDPWSQTIIGELALSTCAVHDPFVGMWLSMEDNPQWRAFMEDTLKAAVL